MTSAEDDPNFVTVWDCVLGKGTATGEISSVYLLAKIVYPSGVGPAVDPSLWVSQHPEYDLLWVYAFAYLPLSVKTDNEYWNLRVGVQY